MLCVLFLRRKTAQVRVVQGKAAGAVSGGTIASLMGAIFDETPEELKLSADPYALNPPEAHRWDLPWEATLPFCDVVPHLDAEYRCHMHPTV